MNIEYLHLDVIPIIFSYLSQYELLNILLTNKFIYNQIIKYINTTKFICIDSDEKLGNGCKNNLIISIKQVKYKLDWSLGLYSACQDGHESLVKLIIKKGANHLNYLNDGLRYSCYSGKINIVNLMIEKGANEWNSGLFYACYGGHFKNKSIVRLMIEKGAKYCVYCEKSMNDHINNNYNVLNSNNIIVVFAADGAIHRFDVFDEPFIDAFFMKLVFAFRQLSFIFFNSEVITAYATSIIIFHKVISRCNTRVITEMFSERFNGRIIIANDNTI